MSFSGEYGDPESYGEPVIPDDDAFQVVFTGEHADLLATPDIGYEKPDSGFDRGDAFEPVPFVSDVEALPYGDTPAGRVASDFIYMAHALKHTAATAEDIGWRHEDPADPIYARGLRKVRKLLEGGRLLAWHTAFSTHAEGYATGGDAVANAARLSPPHHRHESPAQREARVDNLLTENNKIVAGEPAVAVLAVDSRGGGQVMYHGGAPRYDGFSVSISSTGPNGPEFMIGIGDRQPISVTDIHPAADGSADAAGSRFAVYTGDAAAAFLEQECLRQVGRIREADGRINAHQGRAGREARTAHTLLKSERMSARGELVDAVHAARDAGIHLDFGAARRQVIDALCVHLFNTVERHSAVQIHEDIWAIGDAIRQVYPDTSPIPLFQYLTRGYTLTGANERRHRSQMIPIIARICRVNPVKLDDDA